jgi:hypothetical protein
MSAAPTGTSPISEWPDREELRMPKGDVETFYENNMWGTQIEGEGPTGDFFEKKEAAIGHGR